MDEQVNKNVPAIRFEGFSEDWKLLQLGDIAAVERGKFSARPRNDPKYFGGNIPFVQTGDVVAANRKLDSFSQTLNEKGLEVSREFPKNTILITIAANIGDLAITEFKTACPDSIVAISVNKGFDTDYLYDFLGTKKGELEDAATTAAQANINLQVLKPLTIALPVLAEQQKIGSFFKQLDTQLNLHQIKLDKLNTLKQAMLQKMFPQGNATEPEIRFKGFRGKWKTNKFGDLVLVQRGGSPRPIEAFITQDDDGINWIKIGDVSLGSRYINKTKEKIRPEGANSSRWVYKGDLILSNSMSFGRPYIMNIDGCIHDGWLLIRNEKNIFDLEFLLQLLSSEKMLSQYRELASGGVVNNLNSALVQSTTIVYPEKEEQQKIGAYFRKLDELIALERMQLDKLKQIKQACLTGMFV